MSADWTNIFKKWGAPLLAISAVSLAGFFGLRPHQEGTAPQANLKPYFSQEQSFIGRGTVENLDLVSFGQPKNSSLTPPKSIWMIAGSNNITVNWSRQLLAQEYLVEYARAGAKEYQSARVKTPFFSLHNIQPNKSYSVRVSSLDKNGQTSAASPTLALSTTELKQTQKVKKSDFKVSAWMPSDLKSIRIKSAFERGLGTLTQINPFWYNFSTDKKLEPKGGARDPELVARSHQNNMLIIPTVTNNFDGQRVSEMFKDQQLQRKFIADLIGESVSYDYDGVDLDFENLLASDRDAFTRLVKDLARGLHEHKKILEVTVQPKKSDQDDWDGPGALDGNQLAGYADRIKIMTYDFSRPDTKPGPIAPPYWIRQVLDYWKTKAPANKIFGGVPLYGYDWSTKTGEASGLDWDSVVRLKNKYKVSESYDEVGAEPFFTYEDQDGPHKVYYQDTQSLAAKIKVIKESGVAGVAAWVLGGDNPNNFLAIQSATREVATVVKRPLNIGLKLDGTDLAVSLTKFSGVESFIVEYGASADNLGHKLDPQKESIIKLPPLKPGETRFIRARALDHSGREIRQSGLARISMPR